MKRIINILIIIVIMLIIYKELEMNYIILYNVLLTDIYNNVGYKLEIENIYYAVDPRKSEVLNCIYISRYMGQDWNKMYFYFDNYGNLSEYCKQLIEHVEYELNKKNNNTIITKEIYYKYMNEFILHTRECIDITGEGDKNKCEYIEHLIETQTDIKKNMCLNNVDNPICNQYKILDNRQVLDGYFDRNMRTYGRDFYSKDRNYKVYNVENNDGVVVGGIALLGCIGIIIYYIYNK